MREEEHRSESEVKVKSVEEEEDREEGEGVKSVEEGERMDEGGWAWVVVLGELIYSQVPQDNFPKVDCTDLKGSSELRNRDPIFYEIGTQ